MTMREESPFSLGVSAVQYQDSKTFLQTCAGSVPSTYCGSELLNNDRQPCMKINMLLLVIFSDGRRALEWGVFGIRGGVACMIYYGVVRYMLSNIFGWGPRSMLVKWRYRLRISICWRFCDHWWVLKLTLLTIIKGCSILCGDAIHFWTGTAVTGLELMTFHLQNMMQQWNDHGYMLCDQLRRLDRMLLWMINDKRNKESGGTI